MFHILLSWHYTLSCLDNQNVLYKMWYVPITIVSLFDLGKDNYMSCAHVNYLVIFTTLSPLIIYLESFAILLNEKMSHLFTTSFLL
jgi:hypothetical protein